MAAQLYLHMCNPTTVIQMAHHLEMSWSLLVEVGVRKATVHELLEGGGGGLSESGGKLIHMWIHMACNTHSDRGSREVLEAGTSGEFLCGSVQLTAVFCSTSDSVCSITHSQCEIPVILTLFPNVSIVLGDICILETSVIAELTVTTLVPLGRLEKGMATHSSTLAWKIPWTEEPGRLQSIGLQRVQRDWNGWAAKQCLLVACNPKLVSISIAWEYSFECYWITVMSGDTIFLIGFKNQSLVEFLIETWL